MKKINVKSFWIKKRNSGFIKKHIINPPKKSEVLIKTIYSGISFGTEKIVFTGSVPKSQIKMMRCPHQEGEFGSDVKYGYMNVGKVLEGSKKIKDKVDNYIIIRLPQIIGKTKNPNVISNFLFNKIKNRK